MLQDQPEGAAVEQGELIEDGEAGAVNDEQLVDKGVQEVSVSP